MASWEDKDGSPPRFEPVAADGGVQHFHIPSDGYSHEPTHESATMPDFRTRFACMTRFVTDRLHLVDFPASEIAALHELLITVWPKGLQDCHAFGQGHEIKIRGIPWASAQGGADDGRMLFCQILEHFYNRGWVLHAAVKEALHDYYGDTLIFRHQTPPPPPCDWLVIALDHVDRLKLIGGAPADLTAAMVKTLGPEQVQKCSTTHKDGHHHQVEIKIKGVPWNAISEDGTKAQLLLLRILDALEACGFALYGNAHQLQFPTPDLLVVHRQKDWRPGMPVWQR